MRVSLGCLRVKRILPVLSLAHPNRLVNLFVFAGEVVSNVLAVSERLEHGENLEFFGLPRLEVERRWVLQVSKVSQWVKLAQRQKSWLKREIANLHPRVSTQCHRHRLSSHHSCPSLCRCSRSCRFSFRLVLHQSRHGPQLHLGSRGGDHGSALSSASTSAFRARSCAQQPLIVGTYFWKSIFVSYIVINY